MVIEPLEAVNKITTLTETITCAVSDNMDSGRNLISSDPYDTGMWNVSDNATYGSLNNLIVREYTSVDPAMLNDFPTLVFQMGFMFGVKLVGGTYDPMDYVFRFYHSDQETGAITELTMEPCTVSMFPSGLEGELDAVGVSNFLCPTNVTDLQLMGNFLNPEGKSIFGGLTYCDPNEVTCNDPPASMIGKAVDLIFSDMDHSKLPGTTAVPRLNTGYRFYLSPYDQEVKKFVIERGTFLKTDYSVFEFYVTGKFQHQYHVYSVLSFFASMTFDMSDYVLIRQEEEVPQPTFTYSFRRNMDEEETEGETVTTSVSGEAKETKKMDMIYSAFYIMANMGGVYAFLMVFLGMCLRPIFEAMLTRDSVNDTHSTNLKAIQYIKAIEDQKSLKKSQMMKSLRKSQSKPKNVDQSFNEEEPLLEGGADEKENNYHKSQSFKRSRSQVRAQNPETVSSVHRSKSAGASAIIPTKAKNYPATVLLYNILHLPTKEQGEGVAALAHQFAKDKEAFNKDRDISRIISKLNMMDFKAGLMTSTLLQYQKSSQGQKGAKVVKETRHKSQLNDSEEEVMHGNQNKLKQKQHVKSINKIVSHEMDQMKKEIMQGVPTKKK